MEVELTMEAKIKKEGQRIEVFDGIRGLASLIVMFFHLCVWSVNGYRANTYREFVSPFWEMMTNTPLKIFWGGNEAVLVFYIIGGFVLAKPYLTGRKLAFVPFIIRRWIRVMLPYLIILTVSYLLIYLFGNLKADIALGGSFNVKWSRLPNPLEMLLYYLGYDYHLNIVAGAFWSMVQEWRVSFVIPFVARCPSSLQDETSGGYPGCPAVRLECLQRVGHGQRDRLVGAACGFLQSDELLRHLFHHRSGIGETYRCCQGICPGDIGPSGWRPRWRSRSCCPANGSWLRWGSPSR